MIPLVEVEGKGRKEGGEGGGGDGVLLSNSERPRLATLSGNPKRGGNLLHSRKKKRERKGDVSIHAGCCLKPEGEQGISGCP